MDAHNCLEVIVVRGSADDVKVIADRLISTTGVKHGKLVCTSTGEKF
jgi:CopG family nickel-responsive transcriptional regulator